MGSTDSRPRAAWRLAARWRAAPLLACFLLASCWSVDAADLEALAGRTGIAFCETAPPEGAQPLASLSVAQHGFYLLGFVPLAPIDLEESFEKLAKKAKAYGARGVAKVRYEVEGPSPLRFVYFPLPDWTASIRITGMAWK